MTFFNHSSLEYIFVITTLAAVLIAVAVHFIMKKFYHPSMDVQTPKKNAYTNCRSPECVRCSKYKTIKANAKEYLLRFVNTVYENEQSELARIEDAVKHIEKCETMDDDQKPNVIFVKGLSSNPVWNKEDFSSVNDILHEGFSGIMDEFSSISQEQAGWSRNDTPTGSWFIFSLINQGRRVEENCKRVPRTIDVLNSIPNVMDKNVFGNVCFSVIEPGTHISPHYGPCNIRVRCHMGLITPPACVLTVGGTKVSWTKKTCLYFDDSFLHEAEHCGSRFDTSRVILLIDLWHPELTQPEKEALNFVFQERGPQIDSSGDNTPVVDPEPSPCYHQRLQGQCPKYSASPVQMGELVDTKIRDSPNTGATNMPEPNIGETGTILFGSKSSGLVECTACEACDPQTKVSDEVTKLANTLSQMDPHLGFKQTTNSGDSSVTSEMRFPTTIGSTHSHPKKGTKEYEHVTCDTSVTDSMDSFVPQTSFLFPPLPNSVGPLIDLHAFNLSEDDENALKIVSVTCEDAHKLEEKTVGQGSNPLWSQSRLYRVTASNFGPVHKRRVRNYDFAKSILLESKDLSRIPAIRYGRENEAKAIETYTKYMVGAGHSIKTFDSGIVVNPAFPWLGASPDGKVLDQQAGYGLLEIKCPHSLKDVDPLEACTNPKFCCHMVDGKPKLKENHVYFYQVQGQMGVCGMPWCDFVVYTQKGMLILRTKFDAKFWGELLADLTSFYMTTCLPVIRDHFDTAATKD